MIKIEFSGTGEDVRAEMLKLLGIANTESSPQTSVSESEITTETPETTATKPVKNKSKSPRRKKKTARVASAEWTEEEAQVLLQEIKPNAQNILAELAKKPEGYPRKDLVQELGLKEQTIRGRLSSVGAALHRMGDKPSPISNVKINGEFTYKLNPVVAAVITR